MNLFLTSPMKIIRLLKHILLPYLLFKIHRILHKPTKNTEELQVVRTWWGPLLLQHDPGLTPDLIRNGIYDASLSLAMLTAIEPTSRMLNIGANIGYFSMLAARASAKRIYAIEPAKKNFEILQKNMSSFPAVTCIRSAIGDRTGHITLWHDERLPGSHSLSDANTTQSDSSEDVPITTVDAFLSTQEESIDMILMDIQGAEVAALRGMKQTLSKNPPRFLFLEFWPFGIRNLQEEPETIRSILHQAGYRLAHAGRSSLPDPEMEWDALVAECERRKNGKGFCNLVARLM